jgi:hypothetical protein
MAAMADNCAALSICRESGKQLTLDCVGEGVVVLMHITILEDHDDWHGTSTILHCNTKNGGFNTMSIRHKKPTRPPLLQQPSASVLTAMNPRAAGLLQRTGRVTAVAHV